MIMQNGYADITVEHGNVERIADVTDVVESVTWEGDIAQAYRSLTVNTINTADGRNRRIDFRNGDYIRFSNHEEELFRGRIFSTDIDSEGYEILTVHDPNVFFTKSQTTQTFRNRKASQIVRRLARDFGVAIGDIEDTGFVIPKLVAEQDSLYDVIVRALTITENQNGRRFKLGSRGGNLYLQERKGQVTREVLESGVNIMSADYSQSIEDLRNRLVMTGGSDGQYREVRINDDLVGMYGMMQAVEEYSGNSVSRSEVKQAADRLFRDMSAIDDEANVTGLGIDSVTAGSAIYVVEKMAGIIGGYYVIADTHTYANGLHEMTLLLSATDDLPTLEIREDDEG